MTRAREYFSNYKEEEMDFLVNNTKRTIVERGTINIQRDLGKRNIVICAKSRHETKFYFCIIG